MDFRKSKTRKSTLVSGIDRMPFPKLLVALLFLLTLGASAEADALPTTPLPGNAPIPLTDWNFNSLVSVNGTDRWMIDVHSPWCPACRELKPVWDRLAARTDRDYQVGEINIQVEKTLLIRFGIKQIPAVLLITQEGEVYEYVGAFSVNSLHQFASKGWAKLQAEEGGDGPMLKGCASPATRCGKAIGAVMTVPRWAKDKFAAKRREFKHDFGLVGAILAVPVFVGLCLICALDAYVVRKSRRNRRRRD